MRIPRTWHSRSISPTKYSAASSEFWIYTTSAWNNMRRKSSGKSLVFWRAKIRLSSETLRRCTSAFPPWLAVLLNLRGPYTITGALRHQLWSRTLTLSTTLVEIRASRCRWSSDGTLPFRMRTPSSMFLSMAAAVRFALVIKANSPSATAHFA